MKEGEERCEIQIPALYARKKNVHTPPVPLFLNAWTPLFFTLRGKNYRTEGTGYWYSVLVRGKAVLLCKSDRVLPFELKKEGESFC